MISILLPAARTAAPGQEQSVWGDLRVALSSIAAYAPGVDVVVGWAGAEEPRDLPTNPHVRLIEQPAGITTGSQAWNWCAAQTDADELVILGDDCVLHPDSLRLLLEDVESLRALPGLTLGMVGARSNYTKGTQNIRSSNGGDLVGLAYDSESAVLQADMIVPVMAWVERARFDQVGGFPPTNWFADDLISWDLQRLGCRHFVSRSYVHHVGQRGTGQGKSSEALHDEGMAWLRVHRPDFLIHKLGLAA